MDAVSYSLASKQAQRIEKFIENPDSASGIVTVPKTIASGENITIPAGRVAVLPNVTVDGTLNIDGEVFIPSGSTYDKVIDHSTLPTATTELVSTDFVVVMDATVPKKITLTYFTQELTSATSSIKGIVELATNTETATGTDSAIAVTPAGLMSAFNKTGSAPMFACRAWVNFNGTGTVAIRASGNVSSITDNGVGDYRVNFTTAMPDANYCPIGMCGPIGDYGVDTPVVKFKAAGITSSSSFSFWTSSNNPAEGNYTDMANISIQIVR